MTAHTDKKAVMEPFKNHPTDSGSTEVQISLLTARINHLAGHMETNKKDYSSRLGLLKMVGQRRRLLNYLGKTDQKKYKSVLAQLKLRK